MLVLPAALALWFTSKPAPPLSAFASPAKEKHQDGSAAVDAGRRAYEASDYTRAIQALLAAGAKPPEAAFRYLKKLQRADGSIRYSAQYATTPLWVSAQALPALMRRSFPLK